jgi:hypothetical protein
MKGVLGGGMFFAINRNRAYGRKGGTSIDKPVTSSRYTAEIVRG